MSENRAVVAKGWEGEVDEGTGFTGTVHRRHKFWFSTVSKVTTANNNIHFKLMRIQFLNSYHKKDIN